MLRDTVTIDPYLRVAAIIRSVRGELLVVQHGKGDATFWTCPGGFVHKGESLSYALRRSISDEIGAQIRIGDIACVGEVTLARSERRRIEVFFWAEGFATCERAPSITWATPHDLAARFSPTVVLDALARGTHGAYLGNITDRSRALPAQRSGSRRARV